MILRAVGENLGHTLDHNSTPKREQKLKYGEKEGDEPSPHNETPSESNGQRLWAILLRK